MVTLPVTRKERLRPGRRASYEEYLELAGETEILEWVNGEVIEHMPPYLVHQSLVIYLAQTLGAFVSHLQLGSVIVSPFEVKLWPNGPSREPDLFFVSNANAGRLGEKRLVGPPDLVVEVVSQSSVIIDRVDKFTEYDQAGVREYWIIDPRYRQNQADFYFRDEDGLLAPAGLDENGVYHSQVLSDFWLDTAWLWQFPLPNPMYAVARIISSAEGISAELKAPYIAFLNALKK